MAGIPPGASPSQWGIHSQAFLPWQPSRSDWASSKELKVHTHFFLPCAISSTRCSFLPPSFEPEPSSRSCAPQKKEEKKKNKKREHHKINLVEDCQLFLNAKTCRDCNMYFKIRGSLGCGGVVAGKYNYAFILSSHIIFSKKMQLSYQTFAHF